VKAGKARYLGASSMYAWQFAKAQQVAATRFVSMQNHYNLIYREEEREMIPQCLDQGVGIAPGSSTWRTRSRPSSSRSATRTSRGSRSPTCRIPCRGSSSRAAAAPGWR
jgi:aryl-alcohol dehydrogenase-like predicted oxidoreductase